MNCKRVQAPAGSTRGCLYDCRLQISGDALKPVEAGLVCETLEAMGLFDTTAPDKLRVRGFNSAER